MKLPKVDDGVLWSVAHRLEESKKNQKYLDEYLRVIMQNPEIFKFLEVTIENNFFSDARSLALSCAALTIMTLESQIEADELREMFS